MSFSLSDLPQDWAVWRSPDGWSVGEIYLDDEGHWFHEMGTGETVEAAFARAHEYEEAQRQAAIERDRLRVVSGTSLDSTDIGRPPEGTAEHLAAARSVLAAGRR